MRLGVLGGSFDPVHNAHLIVGELAQEQLDLDRVLFVVSAAQPLKAGRHVASPEQRSRMVELALEGANGLHVDRRELERPGPSFTVDTLRELAREQPGAELVLIMGADVARDFGKWREPEEIRSLAKIAVCHRSETAGPGHWVAGFESFEFRVDVPTLDISSSVVRARVAAALPLLGWVPPAVADYIAGSRLYGSNAG